MKRNQRKSRQHVSWNWQLTDAGVPNDATAVANTMMGTFRQEHVAGNACHNAAQSHDSVFSPSVCAVSSP
jgi:hypothetical protein